MGYGSGFGLGFGSGKTASAVRAAAGAAVVAIGLLALAPAAIAGGDWNDKGISWKNYEDGLKEAKSENKPILLVFYTEWCPHCSNYAGIFHDPGVVALSKNFVMVRVDNDKDAATSAKYAPDGKYIPRTFFLKSDGSLMPEITEQRATYKYFYNEKDPASISRSMNAVLAQKKTAG
jgi:protein-disulfide reductase (glutathione)